MRRKGLASLTVVFVLVMACALTACGGAKQKTARAYGTINNGYFVAASITVEGKKIVDADLEEVMMPQEWAKYTKDWDKVVEPIKETDADGKEVVVGYKLPDDAETALNAYRDTHYVTFPGMYAPAFAAKFIKIDTKYFAAKIEGTGDSAKITYVPCDEKGEIKGTDNLIAKLGTDRETQEWYYNTAIEKPYSFELMMKKGDKLETLESGLVAYNGLLKSANNYWPGNMKDGVKQWQENVNITLDYIIANGIPSKADVDAIKEDPGKKPQDLIAGATWTAFDSYLDCLRNAYELAIK